MLTAEELGRRAVQDLKDATGADQGCELQQHRAQREYDKLSPTALT